MNKEKIYTVFERKDPMKFTILITTYNRLDLLKRAINSALEQTIKCEIIVVDDCSTDDTNANLCKYILIRLASALLLGLAG